MQDELIKSYMEVLFEGKTETPSHEVKGAVPAGKSAFGDFKEGNDSDENVDLETPEESDHNSDDDTGTKESTLDKSSFNNPFDVLYSKILGENSFSFSSNKEIEPSFDSQNDFGGDDLSDLDDLGGDDLGDLDEQDDLGDLDGEDEDLSGEVDLKQVLGQLRDVLSELEKIVSDDDEEEVDDIEDMEDESEEGEEEGSEEEEGEEDEDEDEVVKEESWKEAVARKDQRDSRKGKLASKKAKADKLKKASKYDKKDEDLNEAVKVKGLKKGVNLKPFSGNIKKLQNKKAEVSENKPKATKGKAQTPSTGSGFDGMLKKLSPTAGHNLTKASSHTVSGAVKAGKSLFEQ